MPTEVKLSSYPGMTKWFSPRLLIWAAYRDIAARIFGEFADRRTTEHLADPIPSGQADRKTFVERYDYTGAVQGNEPFWADFVADLGDGFEPTYAIAYLVAADKLYGKGPQRDGIEGIRGLHSGQELPHGKVLLFGGDQIYPWPAREAYNERTFTPYELALPTPQVAPGQTVPDASRHVFAIPGNHDWYDGLNAFDDQFCRARAGRSQRKGLRFGDFQTCQHRSSFAIKLPHNWWIWGADIQLNDVLDSGQLDYFTTVADQMTEKDRFILLTAEPSWYVLGAKGGQMSPEGQLAARNLRELIQAPLAKGAKLCGIISGDWHHYARYNEKELLGNMNLITAGCGGAYVHGTYHLKREIKFPWGGHDLTFRLDQKLQPNDSAPDAAPKQTERNACYPGRAKSRMMALNPFKFPGRNLSFCLAAGMLYWLMTWTFANLKVDFWVDIPPGEKITRGLTQTAFAVRECLQEDDSSKTKLRQSRAEKHDVRSCILGSEKNLFTGTGTVEEWTLQLGEFYWNRSGQWVSRTWHVFWKGVHLLLIGIVNSLAAAVFLFSVLAVFFAIAESKHGHLRGLISRGVQAFLHLSAHLLVMWGLYSGLVYMNHAYAARLAAWAATWPAGWWAEIHPSSGTALTILLVPMEFWTRAVYPLEMVPLGGLIGGLIFAIYLSLAYGLGKVNADWVFSSQRIADYKGFLRMRFEPDKLTIYPICLDSVPERSGWRKRQKPLPGQALVEPKSPLKPRLIEGPIVIRPDEIKRLGPQLLTTPPPDPPYTT